MRRTRRDRTLSLTPSCGVWLSRYSGRGSSFLYTVAGLDPATYVFAPGMDLQKKPWMAGSSPAKGYLPLQLRMACSRVLLKRTAVGQANDYSAVIPPKQLLLSSP